MFEYPILPYYREQLAAIDSQQPKDKLLQAHRAAIAKTLSYFSECLMTRQGELWEHRQDHPMKIKEIEAEEKHCQRQLEIVEELEPLFTVGHQFVRSDMALLNRIGDNSQGELRQLLVCWSKSNMFRAVINSNPYERPSVSGNTTPIKTEQVDPDFTDWDYDGSKPDVKKRPYSPAYSDCDYDSESLGSASPRSLRSL